MARPARELLDLHLASWLGAWPPDGRTIVTTCSARSDPGWDGSVLPIVGIQSPEGTVISVPPEILDRCAKLVDEGGLEALGQGLLEYLPFPAPRLLISGFRWCEQVPDLPDAGVWMAPTDPEVPEWLRPYQEALVALTPEGCAGAVGVKHHDTYGHELAVYVSARVAVRHGIRSLGRQLSAQAARKVLADGAVPTAILRLDNLPSGRLCTATSFLDMGWRCISMISGVPTEAWEESGALTSA